MGTGPSVLAAFVYPGLFYAGTAAVAAPILIHLLARRRFKRIRWAAIEFLIDAERRNRRRVRLEQWILLLLRCLAVLLIALVVSRPYLQPQGLAALLGGRERIERIFLLDDSYSMGYTVGETAVFDSAKQSLVQLIDWLHRQAPDDPVTVLRSSAPAAPVASGVYLDDASTEDLFARIRALQPSQQTLRLDEAIGAVRKMLDENPEIVSASLCVVSDFQRTNWVNRPASPGRAAPSPLGPLTDWAANDRALRVMLVSVGDPEAVNRSVAGLDASQSPFVAGTEGTLQALVANHSDTELEKIDLEVHLGPTSVQTEPIPAVAARQTTSVPLSVTFPAAGFEVVRVELPPDGLVADDVRTAVATVNDAIGILVVNGEPSADPYRDEVKLLTTALRPEGEVFSGNRLQIIDEIELETTELDRHHLVVLANVYRVGDPAAARLAAFVRAGGGLLIFLGDQVDPGLYNDSLYADGAGLLPVALDEIVQASAAGVPLAEVDLLHPVMRVFAGRDNPFLKRLAFWRYFRTRVDQPIVQNSQLTVLARFADAQQTPAIIERTFGAGRVVLVATSCDLEWNDWAKDPSYVVTLLETARYLARRPTDSAGLLVSEPIQITLDPQQYEPDALLRTPGYPAEAEIPVTAAPGDGGETGATGGLSARAQRDPDEDTLVLRWDRTTTAGLYRFVLRRRDPSVGPEDVRRIAVNLDPDESDLTIAEEQDLRRAMPGVPIEYLTSVGALDQLDDASRKELWPGFLVAALVALIGEQALAFAFGRRG